jgi:hypothetical protein
MTIRGAELANELLDERARSGFLEADRDRLQRENRLIDAKFRDLQNLTTAQDQIIARQAARIRELSTGCRRALLVIRTYLARIDRFARTTQVAPGLYVSTESPAIRTLRDIDAALFGPKK